MTQRHTASVIICHFGCYIREYSESYFIGLWAANVTRIFYAAHLNTLNDTEYTDSP